MLSDAARILKAAGRKGKQAVGYQGLRLATIETVKPFKMVIDDIACEFLADDVLVNAQMLNFSYKGAITSGQAQISGYNGASGNIAISDMSLNLNGIFKEKDRVAVASVGINKYLIVCKVVVWR